MTKPSANIDAKRLKAQIDAREVARSLSELKPYPRNSTSDHDLYYAPNRNERSGSLAVYQDGYFDYGSKEYGDIFSLLQLVRGLEFQEALQWLYEFHGERVPERPHHTRNHASSRKQNPLPVADWQDHARQELVLAQEFLWSDHPIARRARQYLYTHRGLTDNTIRRFQLGFNPKRKRTNATYVNKDTGKVEPIYLPVGFLIPWYQQDALVALRIRRPVGTLAKFLNFQDNSTTNKYQAFKGSKISGMLYGADALKGAESVLIVEGEFDLMLATQILGNPVAVISVGSASGRLSEKWLEALSHEPLVISILDTDKAGNAATESLSQYLGELHRPIQLPAGKDITEFVVEHNGDLLALCSQFLTPTWWPDGLPDSIREAVMNYFPKAVICLIELLNEAVRHQLIDPERFSIEQLKRANKELGINTGERNLYLSIENVEGVFLQKLTPNIVTKEGVHSCKNSSSLSGRPSTYYKLLPIETIRHGIMEYARPRIYEQAHVDYRGNVLLSEWTQAMVTSAGFAKADASGIVDMLNDLLAIELAQRELEPWTIARNVHENLHQSLYVNTSKRLPDGWPLKTSAQYRTAYARAVVSEEDEKPRSYRVWKQKLGASKNTAKRYLKNAGLKNEPQYTQFQLHISDSTPQGIEKAIKEKCKYGRLVEFIVANSDGNPINPDNEAPTILSNLVRQGHRIVAKMQTASKAKIISADRPPKITRKANPESDNSSKQKRDAQGISKPKTYYGPGYCPDFLRRQLRLIALTLELNKLPLRHPISGVPLSQESSNREIIETMLANAQIGYDPLLTTAIELGAVLRKTTRKVTRSNERSVLEA